MSGMMEIRVRAADHPEKVRAGLWAIKSRSTAGATSCRFDLIAAQAERWAEDGKRSTEND